MNWEANICKHIANKEFASKYTKNANTSICIKNRKRSAETPGQRRYTDSIKFVPRTEGSSQFL